jgi:hypothetical protein
LSRQFRQPRSSCNAAEYSALPAIFPFRGFHTFANTTLGGDTDFNNGLSVPTAGEWEGVSVQSGGQLNSNSYADFRYVNYSLCGALSSQTWQGPPVYTVTGTAVVLSGVTLTIAPEAILKFNAGAGIRIQTGATLSAVGTLAQPIYFTSIKDDSVGGDTNGDGNVTLPAGNWGSNRVPFILRPRCSHADSAHADVTFNLLWVEVFPGS